MASVALNVVGKFLHIPAEDIVGQVELGDFIDIFDMLTGKMYTGELIEYDSKKTQYTATYYLPR